MTLNDFQALSFDCYGTLIDWESGLLSVLEPWARGHGLTITDEELLRAFGQVEAQVETDHPSELYQQVLAHTMRGLGHRFGAAASDRDAARLAGSVPDWPAFADSHDSLTRLSKRFALIILSNVDRVSFAGSNRRLGVKFTSVLTAQDIGSYKPAARNFDALIEEAQRLRIGRGQLLHVAQSLFHDHVPAKNAGLATVWINRRHARPGWGATPAPELPVTPDWEFSSLLDFADAVDAA